MKKFRLLSVALVLFSVLGFTACDTEPVDPVLNNNNGQNPGTNPGPGGTAVFKVDVDGETFTASAVQAQVSNGLFTIVGATSASVVSLSIDTAEEGTYNEALMSYFPNVSSPVGYSNINPETFQNNGTVIITEIDYVNKTVSGTFSFTGYFEGQPSVALTNGIFQNVPVTGLPGQPGEEPVGEKYIRAKIDGNLVNFGTIMTMGEGDFWILTGTNAASQETMHLNLNETITPGTYALEEFADYSATYTSLGGFDVSSETGTLTIISHANGWIKGTFSFSGEDFDGNPHSVTEGEFNVQY